MKKTTQVTSTIAGILFFIALTSSVWAADPNDPNNVVATPVFTPDGGVYQTAQTVVITCATPGATIRYTIDGSDPNNGTIIANGGSIVVSVDSPTFVKAKAFKTGWTMSNVKTAVYCHYAGGSGTAQDPYQINSRDIFLALAIDPNQYNKCFILTSDIDLDGQVFTTAIIDSDSQRMFTGIFDGNGHIISNFTINGGTLYGLFGYIGPGSEVRNLGIESFSVIASFNSNAVGGLVGVNDYGSVRNCFATGIVSGSWSTGGLVGYNYHGNISNCYSAGPISGSDDVGGLVGIHSGNISNCYAIGSVSGDENIGGLVGLNYGNINNSYSIGFVSGSSYVGGLIGQDLGAVQNSFWDIQTSERTTSAGGTGKTTAQMKTLSTFTSAGWDFSDTDGDPVDWFFPSPVDYPILFWELFFLNPNTVYPPMFSIPSGSYNTELNVIITCYTTGATIHYTTNGLDPTESDSIIASGSSVYIDQSLTLKARAWKESLDPSSIKSATYQLVVSDPNLAPGGGTYNTEKTVMVTCATAGAEIHYTVSSDPNIVIVPTESDPVIASGSSITVDRTMTIRAKAWKGSMTPSGIKSATYTVVVSTPAFSVAGGTYNIEKNVVITCATSDATIHYTTNGLDPTESDPVIASGSNVYVDHTLTLKARAWKGNMTPSIIKSATYQLVVTMPIFSVAGGIYNTEQNVTITCATSGAAIHYTTNGADPTESDPVITSGSSVYVDHTLTLKAKAWKDGFDPSSVKSATYQIVVATPVFTPDGGPYSTEQNVVITCATSGATIHYTTNGIEPTESDPVITSGSSVYVDHTLTLKAKAWKDGFDPSSVKSATYQIVVATPVFTPDGGPYSTEQNVVITCATAGATIHYTTNMLDPTESDPAIENGGSLIVSVDPPTNLKARAWKAGFQTSAVKSAWYGVTGVIHVKASATGANTGTSWADAYTDLQSALNVVTDPNLNTVICVAAGTYVPTIKVGGTSNANKTFQLKNGIALYGGFAGNETSRQQRDWAANETILSGDIGTPGYNSDNCYYVFYHPNGTNLDPTAILDGFTIRDGHNYGSNYGGGGNGDGAGMYNDTSSPTIRNCIFSHNYAEYNFNDGDGADIHIGAGAGMYNFYSNPVLINCVFIDNKSKPICEYGFWSGGGAIFNTHSNPVLINCTFTGNSGGVYNNYNSIPVITNCILWGNSYDQIYNDNISYPDVTYSDIEGGYSGTGNIDADPLFLNDPNLNLQEDSPCIDAGNNYAVPAEITTDLTSEPRIIDGNCNANPIVDMGAYEYYMVGDLNATCSVNMDDFNQFSQSWQETGCEKPDNCNQADLDRNRAVELDDLTLFAEQWLEGI